MITLYYGHFAKEKEIFVFRCICMMVSFGGAACWLYLFPMALAINSCMPDYTQHYCTFDCGHTTTYAQLMIMKQSHLVCNGE